MLPRKKLPGQLFVYAFMDPWPGPRANIGFIGLLDMPRIQTGDDSSALQVNGIFRDVIRQNGAKLAVYYFKWPSRKVKFLVKKLAF